jgi:hypothetical protein
MGRQDANSTAAKMAALRFGFQLFQLFRKFLDLQLCIFQLAL